MKGVLGLEGCHEGCSWVGRVSGRVFWGWKGIMKGVLGLEGCHEGCSWVGRVS